MEYVDEQPAPVAALGVLLIYATSPHFPSKGERQHTCLVFEDHNLGDDDGDCGVGNEDHDHNSDMDLVDSRAANCGTGIVQGEKGQEKEQVLEQVHQGEGGVAGGEQQVIHRVLYLKPKLDSPLLSLVSGVLVASKPACRNNCLSGRFGSSSLESWESWACLPDHDLPQGAHT